jgi:hypothetical protein
MSKNEKKSGSQINRRGFLKGITAAGAMATMAAVHPSSAAQAASENKVAAKSWRDKPDPIDESLISDGGTYDAIFFQYLQLPLLDLNIGHLCNSNPY